MSIPILYEDGDVVAVEKPRGVLTEGELPALLREACGTLFVVHRLDKGTGGAIVLARSSRAAAYLTKAIGEGRLQKEYLAVVHGAPAEKTGEWTDLLYHDPRKNKSFVVGRERRGVRSARLDYAVQGECEDEALGALSLVRIRLYTGRTHQIRVQFSSRGLPLAGDRRYGARDDLREIALWSHTLSFPRPADGETVTVVSAPPAEMPWNLF